jgi:phosphoribosylanthranilate isomerase
VIRIKICCISSIAEAQTAISFGASAIGLVAKMPSGQGVITDDRKNVEQSKVPVFLAGGLNAGNVREAIELVQPFGVDVCSGVRTEGKPDQKKLEAFFKAVWG